MNKHCKVFIFMLLSVFCLSFTMAESAEETTKELEIDKILQGGQRVILCFYEPTDPNWNVIKATIDSVGNNFKGAVEMVYVNSADENEKELTEKFVTQSGYVSVFVLTQPRNIVAELRGSDITKENLMKALFPSRKPGGGCCSGGSKPSGCSGGSKTFGGTKGCGR